MKGIAMRTSRSRIAAAFGTAVVTAGLVLGMSTAAHAARLVGTDVHVSDYCTAKYGAASFAFNINGTWSGWRCNKMSVIYQLDMSAVCRNFYGRTYPGVYALNPTKTWNGWHCYI
jgi:hypothetical protein